MAEALEKNTTLAQLNFISLTSGNRGALAMAKALAANRTLTELTYFSLSHVYKTIFRCQTISSRAPPTVDQDTPEGIQAFAEAMRQNTTIRSLSAPGSNDMEIIKLLSRNGQLAMQH